jgi:hypothetical protein
MHLYRGNPIPGHELSPAAPHDPAQLGLLIAHLAGLGYGISARDDNTMTADKGCCSEVTFLRVEAAAAAAAGRRRRWGALRRQAVGGAAGGWPSSWWGGSGSNDGRADKTKD